jgi:hypothetical protein
MPDRTDEANQNRTDGKADKQNPFSEHRCTPLFVVDHSQAKHWNAAIVRLDMTANNLAFSVPACKRLTQPPKIQAGPHRNLPRCLSLAEQNQDWLRWHLTVFVVSLALHRIPFIKFKNRGPELSKHQFSPAQSRDWLYLLIRSR